MPYVAFAAQVALFTGLALLCIGVLAVMGEDTVVGLPSWYGRPFIWGALLIALSAVLHLIVRLYARIQEARFRKRFRNYLNERENR